jgi:undecaprenyl-diphosphatase
MWPALMNRFDFPIMHWANSLAGVSATLDAGMQWLYRVNLIKGAFFVSIFWWYWFRKTDAATEQKTREHVLSTLCAAVIGIVMARVLALALPFRVRPRFEPTLHFILPAGATPNDLIGWSGFPSDHAVMFSALATGLCFISWRVGALAMFYAIFVVSFPRVYMGVHYPTDVLAGVVMGAIVAYCLNLAAVRRRIAGPALHLEHTSPGVFYVALFFLSFEFSTTFSSLIEFAFSAAHMVSHLIAAN